MPCCCCAVERDRESRSNEGCDPGVMGPAAPVLEGRFWSRLGDSSQRDSSYSHGSALSKAVNAPRFAAGAASSKRYERVFVLSVLSRLRLARWEFGGVVEHDRGWQVGCSSGVELREPEVFSGASLKSSCHMLSHQPGALANRTIPQDPSQRRASVPKLTSCNPQFNSSPLFILPRNSYPDQLCTLHNGVRCSPDYPIAIAVKRPNHRAHRRPSSTIEAHRTSLDVS